MTESTEPTDGLGATMLGALRILAVDPSLTGTGWCYGGTDHAGTPPAVGTVEPPSGLDDIQRLRFIRDIVANLLHDGGAGLLMMEAPAFSSRTGKPHERAGLWWMIRETADLRDIPVATVTPGQLKKYATGKGGADKDTVLIQAVRRFPIQLMNNNEADASVMWCMAADHYGAPLVQMPAAHRVALDAVDWPAL